MCVLTAAFRPEALTWFFFFTCVLPSPKKEEEKKKRENLPAGAAAAVAVLYILVWCYKRRWLVGWLVQYLMVISCVQLVTQCGPLFIPSIQYKVAAVVARFLLFSFSILCLC